MVSLRRAVFLACMVFACGAFAAPSHAVEIPPGYRQPPYLAATPNHLPGAVTVTAEQAESLLHKGAVLIDASPLTLGSYGDKENQWILKADHVSIAGSVWLPNVGEATPAPALEQWFTAELARLTQGNTAHPIVFFCRPDCWMSWNAGKRALSLGYSAVYWFRDGIPGWELALLPLTPQAQPVPFYDPAAR